MFAEMFGVELAAAVEASTEKEDKKAEKTSLKEEVIKEVRKDVEIKVDEREKPKVPVSLFDVSPGFVRPVLLSKPELDLLPKLLKDILPPVPKEVINNKESEIKETKVEEEKKAKPGEPKVAVCPSAQKTATETAGMWRKEVYGCDGSRRRRTSYEEASNQPAQSSVSDKKASNQSTKSPVPNGKALNTQDSIIPSKDAPEQSAKSSVADCGFDCTNMGTWNGAENEPKQCSVGGAQEDPRSKVTDVLNERAAKGNGNAPSR